MDKQIIDEERMFECVWCKYGFKESDANFILSENPNECVCSGCITEWADNLLCDLKRKEQECEELKKGYSDLTEIVTPYIDDFTGYNEELGGFDIVLCVKELMEQLDQLKAENRELKAVHSTNIALADELFKYKAENERLKKEIRLYDCIDKWGTEQCHCACRCLGNEFCNEADKKMNKFKQTLTEIKEIAEYFTEKGLEPQSVEHQLKLRGKEELAKIILNKISECEVTNE